jgi:hypothetical protein
MSKPSSNKAPVEEGRYTLVFKTVADIGTQTVKKFKKDADDEDEEEEKKQLIIVVEVVDHKKSTKENPVTLSKWITNSVGKKSTGFEIMKACGLNPKTADWDDILNKAVEGIVEHTDGGNAKIKSFLPLKKGQKAPRGFLPTNSVYLDDNYDAQAFEAMPEFIQNAILKAPEFEEVSQGKSKKKKTPPKKAGKKGKK